MRDDGISPQDVTPAEAEVPSSNTAGANRGSKAQQDRNLNAIFLVAAPGKFLLRVANTVLVFSRLQCLVLMYS